MRDPLNRTKSFYKMQLNNKKLAFHNHAKKGFSFFITKLKINQNCICKFILGDLNQDITEELYKKVEKNIKNFWFIINFEDIENDIQKLANKLKIKFNLEHIVKSNKKELSLSTNEIDLLYKHNEFDLKLFNFYKNNLKVN